jgi:Mg2+/Co2+ transporter CorB
VYFLTLSAWTLVAIALATALCGALAGYMLGARRSRTRSAQRPSAASAEPVAATDRSQLADKMLGLDAISVEDIMIPRGEIAFVDVSDDWDTILDVLRSTPHTRLPVCQGNLDNIVGILHMKKVARAMVRGDFDRDQLLELAREREAYFVPEGTTLDVQLLNFKRDRRRIALVVDEYGDIQGLVTLEDILEEIVGEFTSAPATLHKDIHRDSDGSYVVNGSINARVLNRTLGWNLPTDGPRTLNGLIVEYLETLPQAGTMLRLGDLTIEILQTVDNSVKTARIRPVSAVTTDERSKGVA